MKKRIAIAVGGLGVLTLVWVLSLSMYKSENTSPQIIESNDEKEEEKATRKPYKSKRFPAAKVKVNSPVKKVIFDTPVMLKSLKPVSKNGIELSIGEGISSSGKNYSIAENIKAVPNSHRHKYEDSQIVGEKFGLVLVKEPRSNSDSIILQNKRTRQLAIMTGVFKIKLHDHDRYSEIQSEYGFKLEANFPGIRLSLLKTEDTAKAPLILEQLIKDPRIERVELEILENPPVPK